jgi:hypothetical protein
MLDLRSERIRPLKRVPSFNGFTRERSRPKYLRRIVGTTRDSLCAAIGEHG